MQQRARKATIGAGVGVVLLIALNYAAFHVARLERLDADIFNGFGGLRARPHFSNVATWTAGLCDMPTYAFLCIVPLAIALYRRRTDIAVTVVAILLGANLTTEWLKQLLHQVRPLYLIHGAAPGAGSWPSGHATASMSLALCVVLAAAPRWRIRAAVLGAAFALGVTYSFLTLGWHYPSDAVAGLLVATTWTFLGVAAHSHWQRRRPVRAELDGGRLDSALALAPVAVGLLAGLVAVIAVVVTHLPQVAPYARSHGPFIVGCAAIGTLALTLAGSLVIVLRRSRAQPFSGSARAATAAPRPEGSPRD
ncbi:MAG TPA: phosphatase PAP2 family protein [Solirubrobacteraceae bacterium]|jgi:membrane-associated phospholipid phosphatase|nr:phosphatase PAP2 family protein [Solirubrobacteraceae bacterium]